MEDYDNMQTLPKDYFLREHNKEFYVQEQIYKKLRFLNELPMVQMKLENSQPTSLMQILMTSLVTL